MVVCLGGQARPTEMLSHTSSNRLTSAGRPCTVDDALEDLLQPARAFATRCALAARLAGEESHEPQARLDRVGRLVHDHDGAGAEHRADLADGSRLERHVEVLGVEPRRRCSARDERLELVPVADATAVERRVDQVSERRDAELHLVDARAC